MNGGHAALVIAAVATPLIIALLRMLAPTRRLGRALTPLAPLPALLLALVPPAAEAMLPLPRIFTGMLLGVDGIGRAFLLLVGLLWTAGAVYARGYIGEGRGHDGFHGFFLLTMAGNIGLVLAGDALSFYLFFAWMTFAAYPLIIHDRTPAALRAGRYYIGMAVAGEGALLAGLLILTGGVAVPAFTAIGDAYAAAAAPLLLASLLAAGFAVKAGLFPLHLWLPLAHPVAPTPASALLSGAMIKAGLLGWLRFLPIGVVELPSLGAAFIVAGLASALLAVVLGAAQREAKTILAYSSVSQMGYMALGVGAGLMNAAVAPAALLAVAIYALHHALAKAALFLAVGVLPPAPDPARRTVLLLAALPALALAGAPLTSGALAKGALKSGAVGLPGAWPFWIDALLVLAALGTTLLMARFLTVLGATEGHAVGGRIRGALLFGPWGALLALGVAGAFWLPVAYRPPAGLDLPGPFYGIGASAWPVALGLALGAAVWRFHTRLPYLRRVRIPAGDILAGLEALLRAAAAAKPGGGLASADRARRRLGALQGAVTLRVARLGMRDIELSGSGMLGTMVLAIAAVIGAAVLLGGWAG
jgi:formate hydrogenlyase subunit 3/multisubunit Na+/H+ antiporter MnhD subunit